jgi:hypothetical protein
VTWVCRLPETAARYNAALACYGRSAFYGAEPFHRDSGCFLLLSKKTFYGLRGRCVGCGNFKFCEVSIRLKEGGETPASRKSPLDAPLAGAAYYGGGLSPAARVQAEPGLTWRLTGSAPAMRIGCPTRPRSLWRIGAQVQGIGWAVSLDSPLYKYV